MGWENVLDEDILKFNMSFAAVFVLNYECLKDYVINQVRNFYSCNGKFVGDKYICEEAEEYKKEVRTLNKNIEDASLLWFVQSEAITQEDYKKYQIIRKKRNDITHELLKNLSNGFTENDKELFADMVSIFNKIDKWWINEIEIPIASEDIPDDYDKNGVCSGQAILLSVINSIVLDGQGAAYKDILNSMSEFIN